MGVEVGLERENHDSFVRVISRPLFCGQCCAELPKIEKRASVPACHDAGSAFEFPVTLISLYSVYCTPVRLIFVPLLFSVQASGFEGFVVVPLLCSGFWFCGLLIFSFVRVPEEKN